MRDERKQRALMEDERGMLHWYHVASSVLFALLTTGSMSPSCFVILYRFFGDRPCAHIRIFIEI